MSEKRCQEQNTRHEGSSYKGRTKRSTKRARRRAEKADPQNAPVKNAYRGYTG
jgi:hypothetical protein